MIKIEFRLDEERIIQEGKYEPEKIFSSIDRAFSKYNFPKEISEDGTICYSGTGSRDDFGNLGSLVISLHKTEWFMEYVDKWLWYNSDRGNAEDDFSVEDILYVFEERRSA